MWKKVSLNEKEEVNLLTFALTNVNVESEVQTSLISMTVAARTSAYTLFIAQQTFSLVNVTTELLQADKHCSSIAFLTKLKGRLLLLSKILD